ncbi:hypothetical protein CIB48_g12174 [Xylaria polymorpha]|nr:hypothetical protein CIB48_g12174 [Xylaria polymorpha]
MAVKAPAIPGYTPITNRIFIRNEETGSDSKSVGRKTTAADPTTILVYGWGDGNPKHVSKYSEGYHALFPSARIVMIINPILAATTQTLPKRTEAMRPIIDTCFPTKDDGSERVIMHVMSNTGGIFAAATLNAYRERYGPDAALPHHLCVSDSTPGSLNFGSEVWRWARAMAMGVPKWFPLPFKFTQALCAALLIHSQLPCDSRGYRALGSPQRQDFRRTWFRDPESAEAVLLLERRRLDILGTPRRTGCSRPEQRVSPFIIRPTYLLTLDTSNVEIKSVPEKIKLKALDDVENWMKDLPLARLVYASRLLKHVSIYTIATTFKEPTVPVEGLEGALLSVVSIDHLPSLLPRESSETFSNYLLLYLLKLNDWQNEPVWAGAKKLFDEKVTTLPKEALN